MSRMTPGKPPERPRAYVVLDTETTGLDPDRAQVWEVVMADLITGEVFWNRRYRAEIPPELSLRLFRGLTSTDLAHLPAIQEDMAEITRILGSAEVVIGYNPFFDRDMLAAEMARCEPPVVLEKWPYLVCAKRVWDQYEPKDRTLTHAYKRFVDRRGFDGAHGALADVQATTKVLQNQLRAFDLHDVAWEDMDEERKLWWGPSHHVLLRDGVLICNFGKNHGIRISQIDAGFWRWLVQRDFQKHVLFLGHEAMRVLGDNLSGDVSDARLAAWAEAYAGKNFQ